MAYIDSKLNTFKPATLMFTLRAVVRYGKEIPHKPTLYHKIVGLRTAHYTLPVSPIEIYFDSYYYVKPTKRPQGTKNDPFTILNEPSSLYSPVAGCDKIC